MYISSDYCQWRIQDLTLGGRRLCEGVGVENH